MKALWISHTAGMLGSERVMMEGLEALRDAGVEVLAVLPEGARIPPVWRSLAVRQTTARLVDWTTGPNGISGYEKLRTLAATVKRAWHLSRLIKQERPDVVITNTLVTPTGAFAAKLCGVPHIWYVHEFGTPEHGVNFAFGKKPSLFLVNALSRRIIVNSAATQGYFKEFFADEKTRLVVAAVERPAGLAWEKAARRENPAVFRLVMVGAVAPGKRQDEAMRAVALLRKQAYRVDLTIVGPESAKYSQYLRKLGEELGITEWVHFAGSCDDPFPYYAEADAALICSRDEAFGRVTVEAMKTGKPVVGARSGGTSDLIRHGFNGFLYTPGDPQDLAAKIALLIDDPKLPALLGDHGYAWAHESFNVGKYAGQLISVLEEARSAASHGDGRH